METYRRVSKCNSFVASISPIIDDRLGLRWKRIAMFDVVYLDSMCVVYDLPMTIHRCGSVF